jgi:uncharacterized protein with NAD-binding domain and iron-sulfur cluster
MGGIAAAWALSQDRGRSKHEITVYERSWRLGGKSASGRNAEFGYRIEEHGLHVLLGFYNSSLEVLRRCYDELEGAPPGIPHGRVLPWRDALSPIDTAFLAEELAREQWDFWKIRFPPNPLEPGIRNGGPTIARLVEGSLRYFVDVAKALEASLYVRLPESAGLAASQIALQFASLNLDFVAFCIEKVLQVAWSVISRAASESRSARRIWMILCFVGGSLLGIIREGIVRPPHDFAALDRYDYKEWLKGHLVALCCPENQTHLTWNSPLVNGIYELAFSGQTTFAAGTVLLGSLLVLFDYRGHVAYRMNAGIGDIVFAPLYLALRERGVKFRFFHRVKELRVGSSRDRVEQVTLVEQIAGAEGYSPLIGVEGLPCWPSVPNAEQLGRAYATALAGGLSPRALEQSTRWPSARERALRRAQDFDVIVLAIPVGALRESCSDLMAAHPPFRDMVDRVRTIPTQAMQLWLKPRIDELHWKRGTAFLLPYARPFNSWADMTHLLSTEAWSEPAPSAIAYLCDTLTDPPPAGMTMEAWVKHQAIDWLQNRARGLWPAFTWEALVDPAAREGVSRFDAQHWIANVDPSAQYTLAERGASYFRLRAAESGFHNVALAGDWVHTRLNAGCLEAATSAGLEAGAAILEGRVHP